jgi:hypothetical protein
MVFAISRYLQDGLKLPEQINLDRRKLLDLVNSDFVDFMDSGISTGTIEVNAEIKKADLHQAFLADYPEYLTDNRLGKMQWFTKYLRLYSRFSPLLSEINPERDERKSGPDRYVILRQPS